MSLFVIPFRYIVLFSYLTSRAIQPKIRLFEATEGGEFIMKMMFYDVKKRMKVEAEVTDRVEYKVNNVTRYAVKGKTEDGRNLTKFVSEKDYNSVVVAQ